MESKDAAPLFAALAQESRLDLLRLLLAAGPTGLPAGAVAQRRGLPASTASFHLAALERVGLVQPTRQGRSIVYAARIFALRGLFGFLAEACCGGEPERCGDLARLFPSPEPPAMTPAFNVLFLCTGNSARSILAEAILASLGAGRFRAFSAGSQPADAPMPAVLARLKTLDHDTATLHAKSWDVFTGPDAPRMDFVITLCDMRERCPDFGPGALAAAWPLPDPAKFTGGPAEQTSLLNELYASLHRRIERFINLPFADLDRIVLHARLDEIGAGPFAKAG